MKKKLKKNIKYIKIVKDIIIILGIPTFFVYMNQMHTEQMNNKNAQIEMLQTKIDFLENNQVENLLNKYKSIKEYSEIVEEDLKKALLLNESLSKSFTKEGDYYKFHKDQVLEIYKGLKQEENLRYLTVELYQLLKEKNVIIERLLEERKLWETLIDQYKTSATTENPTKKANF